MRRKKRHIEYLIDLERKIKKGYPVRFKTRNEFRMVLSGMLFTAWMASARDEHDQLKALLRSSIKGRDLPYGYIMRRILVDAAGNDFDNTVNRKNIQDIINESFGF